MLEYIQVKQAESIFKPVCFSSLLWRLWINVVLKHTQRCWADQGCVWEVSPHSCHPSCRKSRRTLSTHEGEPAIFGEFFFGHGKHAGKISTLSLNDVTLRYRVMSVTVWHLHRGTTSKSMTTFYKPHMSLVWPRSCPACPVVSSLTKPRTPSMRPW